MDPTSRRPMVSSWIIALSWLSTYLTAWEYQILTSLSSYMNKVTSLCGTSDSLSRGSVISAEY